MNFLEGCPRPVRFTPSILEIGTRIWFVGESRPYRVRAKGRRYAVCTKPFNILHTVLYTIIDTKEWIRGTENLVFGMGAETDQQCQEMLARIEGRGDVKTEISRRNRVPMKVRSLR